MGEVVAAMNSQPLVSIALPAYNAEATLGDAIASILLQTYQNWELLLIDDGSSDRTVAVARSFDDPRIRLYADGVNKGLPARLNEAIDIAAGKYFARMDNDDICFPERLQRQVEYLEQHDEVDLLATRALTFVTPGRATGLLPFRETHAEICAHPWRGFYMPHPTWMGRLSWFRKHRYRMPEVRRAEDQELLLRSYPKSCFACLPEILLAYRQRTRISLKINAIARYSLLQSQVRIFSARREWGRLLMSAATWLGKSLKDVNEWVAGSRAVQGQEDMAEMLPRWEKLKSDVVAIRRQS
jgi:glycosyltransferase involved in cell wall biosynthesis